MFYLKDEIIDFCHMTLFFNIQRLHGKILLGPEFKLIENLLIRKL